MQKKIIALAVAALASSAAFAQSNVTIYGVADAYVGSFKTDDAKRSTQVNSGGLAASRIGFKGAEDLGNGLKAIFALEYRLDIDGNNSIGGTNATNSASTVAAGPARQQYVGLTGNFGTAVAGRLQTTGYDWAVAYDVLAGTAISPLQAVNGSNFLIGGTTAAARASNAVAYISPSFGGVTFAFNHAYLAEQGTATYNNSAVADLLSANYSNGALGVGLVYARVSNKTTADATYANVDKASEWALGASYDFKVAKAFGTYQRNKAKGVDTGATYSLKADKAWSLGVAVPVTAAGTVIASYAKNSIRSTDTPSLNLADNTSSYTLAYTHGLSKRTTAYAGYTAIKRGNDILVTVDGAADVGGRDTNAVVVGLNHKF
jgi:predicted porin